MRVMVGVASAAMSALLSGPAPTAASPALGNEDPGTRFAPVYATMAEAWTGVAPCLGVQQTSAQTLFDAAPPASAKIAGLKLSDTTDRLTAFKAIARRSGKTAIARAKAADCADVACAVEAMFGPEIGPQIVELAVRYHYVAADKKTAWRAGELEELTASLSDLPDAWYADAKGYRLLVRRHGDSWSTAPIPSSLTLVAMAGAGLPGILVQDGWSTLRPNARRAAIVHEMAHEFSLRQPGRFRGAWRGAVAADEAQAGRASAVSAYATTNAEEDFAESVTAYRYMAPALMRRAPNRYAFLKAQVFGGLEYGSEAKCRRQYAAAEIITGR